MIAISRQRFLLITSKSQRGREFHGMITHIVQLVQKSPFSRLKKKKGKKRKTICLNDRIRRWCIAMSISVTSDLTSLRCTASEPISRPIIISTMQRCVNHHRAQQSFVKKTTSSAFDLAPSFCRWGVSTLKFRLRRTCDSDHRSAIISHRRVISGNHLRY